MAETSSVTVLLAQFQALRAEIEARSGAQTTILGLTVTALGALAALGFSEHGDMRLLLLVPVISAILGLIWIDHAANISNLGDFINQHLMPALKKEAAMDSLPDYEDVVRLYERRRTAVLRLFGLPPFLVFVLTPVVAMLIAFDAARHGWLFWSLFGLDIALLLVFIAYWAPFLGGPRQRA